MIGLMEFMSLTDGCTLEDIIERFGDSKFLAWEVKKLVDDGLAADILPGPKDRLARNQAKLRAMRGLVDPPDFR